MPDLKSELAKLKDLKFDDDVEASPNDHPTGNQTKSVFEYIHKHPMSAVSEVADAIGLGRSRVATLVIQLTHRNILTRKKIGDEPYQYTAAVDKFPETDAARLAALTKAHAAKKINAAKRKAEEAAGIVGKKLKAKLKVKPKSKAPIATIDLTPPPPPPPPPVRSEREGFSAAMLVGGLTPFQARQVYDELKKLFA